MVEEFVAHTDSTVPRGTPGLKGELVSMAKAWLDQYHRKKKNHLQVRLTGDTMCHCFEAIWQFHKKKAGWMQRIVLVSNNIMTYDGPRRCFDPYLHCINVLHVMNKLTPNMYR